ncbi:MAG: hypothetical protein EOO15_04945 [Chitinophagaceae bacterium]|nr:MAG: hypothetical protein EOO15_04945 [Chitinophagaceae bacterium]
MPLAAVITADIVNSTSLAAKQAADLRKVIEGIFDSHKLEFYRGDSFQALVKEPGIALRLVLRARSAARSIGGEFDVRCSIGIGNYNSPVRSLATASGEAFLLSGRSLDAQGGGRRLAIVSAGEEQNAAFRLLAAYSDHLLQALTAKQASVVHELLSGKTQSEAGARLGITQATISSHAQSAAWNEIEYLLSEYEALCASAKN